MRALIYHALALDLCDALSSFRPQAKATLDEISKIMGMPGSHSA